MIVTMDLCVTLQGPGGYLRASAAWALAIRHR
jgi:hypothetical protein